MRKGGDKETSIENAGIEAPPPIPKYPKSSENRTSRNHWSGFRFEILIGDLSFLEKN